MKKNSLIKFAPLLIIFLLIYLGKNSDKSTPLPPEYEEYKHLAHILKSYEENGVEVGIEDCRAYVEANPQDDVAHTLLGGFYLEMDSTDAAKEAYLSALKENSDNYQALNGLGVVYRSAGEYDKAAKQYEKSLQIKPNNPATNTNLALTRLKQNRFPEALELAEKAYRKAPQEPTIVANLAVICHYNNLPDESSRYLREAEALGYEDPDFVRAVLNNSVNLLEQ